MAKLILIDSSYGLIRTAISQGGRLLDYYEESPDQGRTKGNIYKGIIKNVDAHIQAAFVRYGGGRDGFLPLRDEASRRNEAFHSRDVPIRLGGAPPSREESSRSSHEAYPAGSEPAALAAPPASEKGGKRRRKPRGKAGGQAAAEAVASKPLGPGDAVLVQVVKDEVGAKGAALTTKLSLSGRYLVYMPGQQGDGGVSSRLPDEERAAMKAALAELQVPQGASVILRTAAAQRSPEELQADLDRLIAAYRDIEEQAYDRVEPGLIHRDLPPASRYLREYCTPDVEKIWVNSEELLAECREFFALYEPKAAGKVQLSPDGAQMFQRLGLEAEVERLSARKVSLPSGANFVIDQTEALVAIDVNSARSKSDGGGREGRSRDLEDAVFAINMEAGAEIARQLRLRDLGGIIIVDFIDMEEDRHRRKVEDMMRRALAADKAKVKVYDITPLGLMQISRQRLRKAGPHFSRTACPACQGRGWQSSPAAAALAVLRRLEDRLLARKGAGHVAVTVPYPVANHLHNEFRSHVEDLERRHGCAVRILADANASGEAVFQQPQDPARRPEQSRPSEGRPQREQKPGDPRRDDPGRRRLPGPRPPGEASQREQGRGKGRRDKGRMRPEPTLGSVSETAFEAVAVPLEDAVSAPVGEAFPEPREAVEVPGPAWPEAAGDDQPSAGGIRGAVSDGVDRQEAEIPAASEGSRARRGRARGRGRRGGKDGAVAGSAAAVRAAPLPAETLATVAPRAEPPRRGRRAPKARPEPRPMPETKGSAKPEPGPEAVAVTAGGDGDGGNGRRRRRRGGRGNRGGGSGNPQGPQPQGPRPQGPRPQGPRPQGPRPQGPIEY